METTKYTKEYFIDKFSKIPEDDWGRLTLDNHCAMYHCGAKDGNRGYIINAEIKALAKLLISVYNPQEEEITLIKRSPTNVIWIINDKRGDSPKNNILNVLNSIK